MGLPTVHTEPAPVMGTQSASESQFTHSPKPPQNVSPEIVVKQRQVFPPLLQRADVPLTQKSSPVSHEPWFGGEVVAVVVVVVVVKVVVGA